MNTPRVLAYLHGYTGMGALRALLDHACWIDLETRTVRNEAVRPPDLAGLPTAEYPQEGYDLVLCAGWREILSPKELAQAPLRWNVHSGSLPEYAGRRPVQRAIADDAPVVCALHEMVAKVDSGPILAIHNLGFFRTEHRAYRDLEHAARRLVGRQLRLAFPGRVPTDCAEEVYA